jgi:hypothetical protein
MTRILTTQEPAMKTHRKKLALQRENIRMLDAQHLGAVAGGVTSRFCTWDRLCPQGPDGPLEPTRDC